MSNQQKTHDISGRGKGKWQTSDSIAKYRKQRDQKRKNRKRNRR